MAAVDDDCSSSEFRERTLSVLKSYAEEYASSSSTTSETLPDLPLNLSLSSVKSTIEYILFAAESEGFSYSFPSPSSTFVSAARRNAVTTRLLLLVHELCRLETHSTSRQLFYADSGFFQDQSQVDAGLNDVCSLLGCTISSLNVVVPRPMGSVVGRLTFKQKDFEKTINCMGVGESGHQIPRNIEDVSEMKSDALFILVVDDEDVHLTLTHNRFCHDYPCVIIYSRGGRRQPPDVAVLHFLRKMKMELKLPVLALLDPDPHGLKVLSVYGRADPDIKWLGLRTSDPDVLKKYMLAMTDRDVRTVNDMLQQDFVKKNPELVEELTDMMNSKKKCEIMALHTRGSSYMYKCYLPRKLKNKDWI